LGQASQDDSLHEAEEEERYSSEFARVISVLEHRPMLVIDRNFNVRWRCDRTNRLLDSAVPLRIVDGQLIVQDELGPGRFKHFIASLDEVPRRFLVRGRGNAHWAMLHAWRNARCGGDIFMFCTLSIPHCDVENSGIAQDFSLTRAETAVLTLFANLRSPKEIAIDLGVSISTVRSHIKQIYAKTTVQTGVQLHQLVQTYCAV